jgi:putative OPT family oligopeptide transporter
MIGATPWRQQVMLGVGAVATALVMAPTLNLLLHAYGMGPATADHPRALQAAQATLMESVARGMLGWKLPWNMVIAGGAVGIAIIIADEFLKKFSKTGIRAPVLAAAVGIYLPLDLEVPIFLGGLLSWFAQRRIVAGLGGIRPSAEEIERLTRRGMLFAAGLITGESLIGVAIALGIVIKQRDDFLALPERFQFGGWVGFATLVVLAVMLYRTGTSTDGKGPPLQPAQSLRE